MKRYDGRNNIIYSALYFMDIIRNKLSAEYIFKHENFTFFLNLMKILYKPILSLSTSLTIKILVLIRKLPHAELKAAMDLMIVDDTGVMQSMKVACAYIESFVSDLDFAEMKSISISLITKESNWIMQWCNRYDRSSSKNTRISFDNLCDKNIQKLLVYLSFQFD
jgi:hypothetical protein